MKMKEIRAERTTRNAHPLGPNSVQIISPLWSANGDISSLFRNDPNFQLFEGMNNTLQFSHKNDFEFFG